MSHQIKEQELETNLALIKKDVENFTHLFSKIDVTLEKMSEVSNNVGKLLSLHDQRLDILHDADRLLEAKLEKNSNVFSEELKELHEHIRHTNRDLVEKLKSSEHSIKEDIKELKTAVDNDNRKLHTAIEETNNKLTNTNKRIDVIEKWKWMVWGGAIIIGFLVTKLPISFSIT